MAATSGTTFSIRSAASTGSKYGRLTQSNSSGLKSVNSVGCESKSSFLDTESSIALKRFYRTKPHASYKVAILGAAGGIGRPLALLIKMSPLVFALNLYDIANVKRVAADLSHCDTPSQVEDFAGASELGIYLKDVNVVDSPACVLRKPGMTRDGLFKINANIVKTLVEDVADNCSAAFIHIISNPLNSTVPIAAEVLKQQGVYDPKKLFVVGGHAGITILPLLSKIKASVTFTDDEVEQLTVRIQNAGTEVVEAKAGAGSATLSVAYAAAQFVNDVYECFYVQFDLTELPFFSSRIKLGRNRVEVVISSELHGLTEYEQKALEALKPEVKASIEKGVAFVRKQPVTAWSFPTDEASLIK
ncbi:NAD-dependent malate dehydrogenase [Handroanthus impetiginosus]|uniref:malate dehydrogenase n=1 Tax=Handroanthus impetiginosus TaxID=429701 RepID=A0A2G9HYC0_9LAMI|nr:NAD-dependent malate dehydrogenase [Handroanthus impetiginosus]